MNGAARTVNVTVLVLIVTVTASGVLAFAVGTPGLAQWVVGVHGASGLGLLLLLPAKSRIVRRGLRRPGRSRKVMGLALAGFALLAAAHVVVHHRTRDRARRARWRPLVRRTDVDRRRALLGTGVVAGSALLWLVAPGRERRETGSHGIADATAVPVTQWMFDPVPRLPGRPLRVPGGEVDLAALPPTTVRAVLDCTGGWYTEQEWRGVRVADLGLPAGASVDVVSATGYRRRFPAAEAGTLLLATHLAGRRLTAGHGAPVRLVAPGRRGFWWVKWVVAVEVVDEPWWWQPPFPLQ
ncbi:molybdopterin-dependent oxidoreductase [Pseudonocardia sp. KRD-184]|uniref:Molybdopterin-dependent oxidoreductase n=1 Tax=Pseudonocardia oceani TaxID=2792013 RepID=A0ABS6U6K1_9PSEU|nr:molybdopterin-dependent oxidoreductase [Pseudonocardia oceani]MBW0091472.1 molybdopterin-dependent oxidoreductase [Pseudonocardia oceani]MBW0098598.1 molybdopterin-dependent oxidoreductase [Pseudonocardia oceani]MBW0111126.1 molybdopterin-dependent oxidoreductase [Pseudonocardia oceani]MBW0120712.1 molybdopterin-dependent oxidoreductase [Pseudonocardia oceani]MBW0127854.1 molybdopterin-dependent oxidoreductase [Pseudonocardia oceani]